MIVVQVPYNEIYNVVTMVARNCTPHGGDSNLLIQTAITLFALATESSVAMMKTVKI